MYFLLYELASSMSKQGASIILNQPVSMSIMVIVWRLIRGALRDKKLRKGMYVHYVHITYVTLLQE